MTFPGALRRILLACAAMLLALAPGLPGSGEAKAGGPPVAEDYAIDQFYDELAPFGDWVYHPNHGYVWLPRAVEPEWRPFTVGRWIYTEEYGWYWESYEPFAWAVYHYGRWGVDQEYGWYWVPGDTWAPAWVQWRYGEEYVGWAPETPEPYGAYAYGGPTRYAPPPPRESWVFVEPRYLTAPAVRSYAVPRTSISIAFSRATHVYRPEYRNGYVYNYGMPRDRWSRITRKHVEPRRIYRGHQHARPNSWNRRNPRDVYVYAPRVKKGAGPRKPPKKVSHKPHRAKDKKTKSAAAAQRARARAQGLAPHAYPRPGAGPRYRGPTMRGRHPMAGDGSRDRHKPPHAKKLNPDKRKAANAKRSNAKGGNAKKDKSKPNRPKSAKAKPGKPKIAGREPGGRDHHYRTHDKPPRGASSSQTNRHRAANVKMDRPKAKQGSANKKKRAPPKAQKPKVQRLKAQRPKAQRPKAQRPKANVAHAGKPKAVKRKAPKPKSAKASRGGDKGNRKHSAGGHGGGGRAKGCKANRKGPGCGRRG